MSVYISSRGLYVVINDDGCAVSFSTFMNAVAYILGKGREVVTTW